MDQASSGGALLDPLATLLEASQLGAEDGDRRIGEERPERPRVGGGEGFGAGRLGRDQDRRGARSVEHRRP